MLQLNEKTSQKLEIDFSNITISPLKSNEKQYIKFSKENENIYKLIVVHSPSDIFSFFNFNVQPNSWMKDLGSMNSSSNSFGQLPLSNIVLPGTHDSGTFNLTLNVVNPPDSFVEDIDKACNLLNLFGIDINCNDAQEVAEVLSLPWSVTQVTNWYGQLQTGCRSFDYRGYYNTVTDEWVAQHSLYGTSKTSPAALSSQVKLFLDENPGEIVLIEYSIYGNGNKSDLVDQFMNGLGKYAYNWDSGVVIPGNPSIYTMIQNNQRAIIVEANTGQRSPVSQGIVNDYPNSCNKTQILSYDANAIGLFAGEQANAMRKLGFQATPDVECIVLGTVGVLVPGNLICNSLFGFKCSADLMGYINQIDQYFTLSYVLESYSKINSITQATYFGNIWNFDHPNWSFIEAAVSLNAMILLNIFKSQ